MANSPDIAVGAIHVHTDMSGHGGTLDDVLEAAKNCGLDFVILTDTGSRGYADESMEGWHDDVLVLCGEEVVTPEGHFLAFATHGAIGESDSLEKALSLTREESGAVVSIHNHYAALNGSGRSLPTAMPMDQADLLEVWCFLDEFLCRTTAETMKPDCEHPSAKLIGPERGFLRKWDRLLKNRMLPAVGGVNARCAKEPLFDWQEIFPYEVAFNSITTVIQTPKLPKINDRACALVWDALHKGRSYVVNRMVERADGFRFEYDPPNNGIRRYQMGETVDYQPGGHFLIDCPVETEIVLRHNGQPLIWGTGKSIQFPASSPGAYRVEAYLNRRLYILSNPIRLVDDDLSLHPTVSDVT